MKNFLKWFGIVLLATFVVLLLLRQTSPDPKFNKASFEERPLEAEMLPISDGWTLAQVLNSKGEVRTVLVVGFDNEAITGADLHNLGAVQSPNPFTVLASLNDEQLMGAYSKQKGHMTIPFSQLLSVAGAGERHLGIGTNFPEHAEEAASSSVFNFPKFGSATPARTTVPWFEGGLLDYEVELCLRFDRPIRSPADFDAATKGFFLCGDFTERATLLRLIDPQNLDSGTGFSDGKSGIGVFPLRRFIGYPQRQGKFHRRRTHDNEYER